MTNTQIVNTPMDSLDAIHKQGKFLLLASLIQHPCPSCLKPINQIEASGLTMDEWDLTLARTPKFCCPHCQTSLVALARFDYQWGRKRPASSEATE